MEESGEEGAERREQRGGEQQLVRALLHIISPFLVLLADVQHLHVVRDDLLHAISQLLEEARGWCEVRENKATGDSKHAPFPWQRPPSVS